MAMNLLLVGKSVELSPSMNLLLLNISKEIVRQQLIQLGRKAGPPPSGQENLEQYHHHGPFNDIYSILVFIH